MGKAGGSKYRGWAAAIFGVAFFGIVLAMFIGGDYINGYIRGSRPGPGDAAKFDAFAVYPQIVQFAGSGVQLLSIDLKFVKRDGTLDLTADYGASVIYTFARIVDSPTSDAPLGVNSNPGVPNAEQINVKVEKVGLQGKGSNRYYNFGMTPQTISAYPLRQSIIDTPGCTVKQLWDVAIKDDVPASAVAIIRYDSNGYSFAIDGTQVHLQFDTTCQLKK